MHTWWRWSLCVCLAVGLLARQTPAEEARLQAGEGELRLEISLEANGKGRVREMQIGGEKADAAVLSADLQLVRRLLLRPEDLLRAGIEATVQSVLEDVTRLTLHAVPDQQMQNVPVSQPAAPGSLAEFVPVAVTEPLPEKGADKAPVVPLVTWVANLDDRLALALAENRQEFRIAIRADSPQRIPLVGPDAKDKLVRPKLVVIIRDHPSAELFSTPVQIREGVYTTVKDGHLYYGEQRLRLWGTLGAGGADRIRKMGFNAFRHWPPPRKRLYNAESIRTGEFAWSDPEAAGRLKEFCERMADFRDNNIFVMAPFCTSLPPPELLTRDDSFVAGGPDWKEWKAAIKKAGAGELGRLAVVDERLQKARRQDILNFLNLKNARTGKRLAEEEAIAIVELDNEQQIPKLMLSGKYNEWPPYFRNKLKKLWNAWLSERYADDAAVRAAWGELRDKESLAAGTVDLAPCSKEQAKYPAARASDFIRFSLDLFTSFYTDLREFCRAQAPEGVGVSVVPFSFDTQFRANKDWHFVNAQGDVVNFGMYFWGLTSSLGKPPGLYILDDHTVAGKPTVLYETNWSRPSPYRTEYPYKLATFASWQDWDAIFFHYWGGPPEGTPDEQYMLQHLLYPNEYHYWNAVHHAADPVMVSALAGAGEIFKRGLVRPASDPLITDVGPETIYSYHGGISIREQAFTRGSKLRYLPGDPVDGVSPGEVPEKPVTEVSAEAITEAVRSGEEILWDWPNQRLIVDTPAAKIYVGKPAVHTFKDGITISGFNQPFVSFAMVSRDSRPLIGPGATDEVLITAVFDARNTSFDIDMSKDLSGPKNQAKAIRNHGKAPVLVDKVDYTVSFPTQLRYCFEGFDFGLRKALELNGDDSVIRLRDRELFMSRLTIKSRGAGAEPVADPVLVAGELPQTAGANSPATDPRLAGIQNPIPGLSWGDNIAQAHQTLRESTLAQGGISEVQSGGDGQQQFTIRQVRVFFDALADVEVVFSRERMRRIAVTFTLPPPFDEAVAVSEKRWGKPILKKMGTQFEGSELRWRRPDGVLIQLAEQQGTMTLVFERPSDRD